VDEGEALSRISTRWVAGVIGASLVVLFFLWVFAGRSYDGGASAFHRAADVRNGGSVAGSSSPASPAESFAAYGPPKDPFRELVARAGAHGKSTSPSSGGGGRRPSSSQASGSRPSKPSRPGGGTGHSPSSSPPPSSSRPARHPAPGPAAASSPASGGALFNSGGNLPLP